MSKLISNAANYTYTENGALTYKSTMNAVLDLFGMGGALRNAETSRIISMVKASMKEDPIKTLQVLFYLRDIRGGQGEKRIFREAIKEIFSTETNREALTLLFDTIVELGSWKDIVEIFEPDQYAFYVIKHLHDENTLMYKWLPSISGAKNADAERLASLLEMSPKEYRKMLSLKRASLNIVETPMCEKRWREVDYNKVPSQANLKYKGAFCRNDRGRYEEYLSAVNNKEKGTKINTSTLLPYQIVIKYLSSVRAGAWGWKSECEVVENKALETLWKNLPINENHENALVIADTSGSMTSPRFEPMAVALSLAIYFAEHNTGLFANEFITFSDEPSFFQVNKEDSLASRIAESLGANWGMSTNFEATFDLILKAAKSNNLPEEEMPKTLYCISDMEFNEAAGNYNTNFEAIKKKYANAGYTMPNLVFWDVASHQDNVPVKSNDKGVALVSGCSPSLFTMVLDGEMNPVKFMDNVIDNPRYKEPAEKICGIMKNKD